MSLPNLTAVRWVGALAGALMLITASQAQTPKRIALVGGMLWMAIRIAAASRNGVNQREQDR